MRVKRAVRPDQARLRGGQLTAAVNDLTDSTHPLNFGGDCLDQIHMQLCSGVARPAGMRLCTEQASAESSKEENQPP